MNLARTHLAVAALTILLGAALLAGVVAVRHSRAPQPADRANPTPRALSAAPLDVLRSWDILRAAAYADADITALRSLYLPGSRAGRRDARLLGRYADRGLRVAGMHTQLLTARVRDEERDRLVVSLTERVIGARAVGLGTSVVLPQGAVRERVVTLVLRDGSWVVGAVRRARHEPRDDE